MPDSILEISKELNSEIISTYELKSRKTCYVCKLNDSHLDQSLELQQIILDDLGPEKKLYIVPKTKEQFSELRDGTHGITLGAFVEVDGQYKLIGQQLLILHETPHHLPSGTLEVYGLTAEFGGDLVAPEYRGNKLSLKMKTHLEEIIKEKGITFITGEIHKGNFVNQRLFAKFGFICANATYDPDDGAPVLYFFKPCNQEVILESKNKQKRKGDKMTVEGVQELTQAGYYGKKWKYDSATKKVTVLFYKHVIS